MRIFGLIGKPLTHSFSKKYFSEKFISLGIQDQYTYENFELESIGDFPGLVNEYPNLSGLNVTVPFKEQVILFLDTLNGDASEIRAVNTIKINRNEKGDVLHLSGFNTDTLGFHQSILPHLRENHKGALILGTGGASKAVSFVLEQLEIPYLFVSRRPTESAIAYRDINEALLTRMPVLINTTPLGTYPNVKTFPDLPYHLLSAQNLLFDLVYNPEETLFLQKGKAMGAQISNGLEMLSIQAEASWKIWYASNNP